MKIVLLFSAFVLIVNGRTLEKGQNKRELLLKALSNIRKKDTWFPWQMTESPDFKPQQIGQNEKLDQVLNVLEMVKESLDIFKEKHGNGAGQGGNLQNEIDYLYVEIKNLKGILSNAITNKNYLFILSWKLYEIHGDNFYNAFIEAVDQAGCFKQSNPCPTNAVTVCGFSISDQGNVFDEDEPLPTAEYGTTGGDNGVLSPKEQLSEIAEMVEEIRRIVKGIVVDGNKSYQLVQAILAGLDNVPTYTTPGYETTTSDWWRFWTTTTEEPTGNSGTTSGESTGNTGTTTEPTSTTENMFVRKKNFLRRQLIDLLQQKLQKKTAAGRGEIPPY